MACSARRGRARRAGGRSARAGAARRRARGRPRDPAARAGSSACEGAAARRRARSCVEARPPARAVQRSGVVIPPRTGALRNPRTSPARRYAAIDGAPLRRDGRVAGAAARAAQREHRLGTAPARMRSYLPSMRARHRARVFVALRSRAARSRLRSRPVGIERAARLGLRAARSSASAVSQLGHLLAQLVDAAMDAASASRSLSVDHALRLLELRHRGGRLARTGHALVLPLAALDELAVRLDARACASRCRASSASTAWRARSSPRRPCSRSFSSAARRGASAASRPPARRSRGRRAARREAT